jgi:hypothetical protein
MATLIKGVDLASNRAQSVAHAHSGGMQIQRRRVRTHGARGPQPIDQDGMGQHRTDLDNASRSIGSYGEIDKNGAAPRALIKLYHYLFFGSLLAENHSNEPVITSFPRHQFLGELIFCPVSKKVSKAMSRLEQVDLFGT